MKYVCIFFFVFSERIDNEMAQEIQEQLVQQAEKQKQQEAKDEVRTNRLLWSHVCASDLEM